jgi:hypothetical protein
VHSQTRPPTEVVLVQDGPVPEALAEAIDLIISKSPCASETLPWPTTRAWGQP